jgi:hypothetical protein
MVFELKLTRGEIMKCLTIILVLVVLVILVQAATADDIFETIKNQSLDSLRAEAKPLVQVFGAAMGGGLYYSASTHGLLGFDVGVRGMVVIVPDGESQLLDDAEVNYIPLPVIQANVGLPLGLGVIARGVAYKFQGQTVSVFGAGVKYDAKEMIPIPMFPHVGAMIAYQQFKGGDILTANVFSVHFMASQSFVMIEPYIGYGYDRTTMNFKYTYTVAGPTAYTTYIDEKFTEAISRLTVGLKFSPFPLLNVYADYSLSTFNSVSAGLSVSF